MNNELRNQSTLSLQALASGQGPSAQCAQRIIEEREEAAWRLEQICREITRDQRRS